ncbi:MAG: hypothetical protein HY293_00440 [Planctomycetes bacterium]|nr:hypothetical protein [Planctomycetota bacterium]
MKKMMLTLALLPSLALAAAAQDTAGAGLAVGDRVEITFFSGATIRGTIVKPWDAAKETALTLDLTWEYTGLNGTLSVPRSDLKSVRKLRVLDDATIRGLEAVKKQIALENAAPVRPAPAAPSTEPAKPAPAPDDKAAKEAEELKKALEMFKKYPSPEWSPERRNAIRLKRYRGQVPTSAESDFEQGFDLWEKGRAASAGTRKD